MAAAGNILINDGQATPVQHTFAAVGVDRSKASYEDRVTGVRVGYPSIMLALRDPVRTSVTPVSIATIEVRRPTLAVTAPASGTGIQPAPTKAYEQMFRGQFFLPERGTPGERDDILAYTKNLLANAVVTALVRDLERPF